MEDRDDRRQTYRLKCLFRACRSAPQPRSARSHGARAEISDAELPLRNPDEEKVRPLWALWPRGAANTKTH